MKKLVLLVALSLSGLSYGQAWENAGSNNQVYLGQDENNYPIYKNINHFESLGAKLAVSAFGAFVTGVTIKIIRDRRKEDEQREKEPLIQENVEI
jgi:hypothetical protein